MCHRPSPSASASSTRSPDCMPSGGVARRSTSPVHTSSTMPRSARACSRTAAGWRRSRPCWATGSRRIGERSSALSWRACHGCPPPVLPVRHVGRALRRSRRQPPLSARASRARGRDHRLADLERRSRRAGPGADDGVLLVPEHRGQHEVPLLRRYHRGLQALGIENYTWEAMFDDYRLCVIRLLFHPARQWQNDEGASKAWFHFETDHARVSRSSLRGTARYLTRPLRIVSKRPAVGWNHQRPGPTLTRGLPISRVGPDRHRASGG